MKNQNLSDTDRERKKQYIKIYYHKGRNVLNDLIKVLTKLENVSLSK